MDFYKSSSRSLNRNLENALNSLQKQSLIKWGNVFTVDEVLVEGEKLVQKETKDKYGNTVISFAKDIEVKHTHRGSRRD